MPLRVLQVWLAGLLIVVLQLGLVQAQTPAPLQIEVVSAAGKRIALGTSAGGKDSLSLHFAHHYERGDRIEIDGPADLRVELDSKLPACRIHRARAGRWSFVVPSGTSQTDLGSAYAPDASHGAEHTIQISRIRKRELDDERNVALNACDQTEQQELAAYPHATTNSSYHQMPVFAARNAIDGVKQNAHHGAWPYESWGPDKQQEIWWQVDFGRMVSVHKLRVLLRADFPHDSSWRQATLQFSDGTEVPLALVKTASMQEFSFAAHRTLWIRLTHLEPLDSGAWCALTELEAWGRDVK